MSMGEWKEYKVSELIRSRKLWIGDGYRAKNVELSSNSENAIPFARAGNIDGGFNFGNADFFPIENLPNIGDKVSKVGDTVFTSKGTVGRFALVDSKTPQFVYSPQLCFWRSLDSNLISPRYLFYWMQGREFLAQVDAVKGQTDMAEYVSLTDQRQMKITLPHLPEQKAIAEVLSSLDDKIDLLHRQNKTLESLAQTLFRQWFIEEADGQIGKLGDVIELRYGKGLKEEVRTGQGFPVVGSSGVVGYHSEYLVEGPGIVIGRKGTLGRVVYIYENFFPIDTTYFVKSKTESDGLFYEYFLLQTLNFEEMNSDSAVPGLNRDIALATEVRIPSPDLRNDFNYQCGLLFQKKKRNTGQIDVLAGLRDSLLPKLMSGEITCG